MKKIIISLSLSVLAMMNVSAQWKPAGDKIMTSWGESLGPGNVLNEYPRPIMERPEWQNLNGLWEYSIIDKGAAVPENPDGNILVPFAPESALSGVGKMIGADKELVYSRQFTVPSSWKGRRVILNFGAVDWQSEVYVNGMRAGSHTGGYTPFSIDITGALVSRGENILTVRVWDPTDKGYQPRGKQVTEPGGIWYTPVTGIWQTVWLEPVGQAHVSSLRICPDIDDNNLTVSAAVSCGSMDDMIELKVFDGDELVAAGRSVNAEPVTVPMPEDVKLWSPDSPFLYGLELSVLRNGKVVDKVKSYAAMRKYSVVKDKDGIMRLALNNKVQFQFGPLDQGWWPDGLYTAPSDDALVYDLYKTKEMGFNMIRKHIKVEPARWYTWCDRLGIMVWQDMPSGDTNPEWMNKDYFSGRELERSPESEACYMKEWKEIIDCLYNYPCIGVWVPFNEAWGQFKTEEIALWTKTYDPSRIVNPASGGNHYHCGDILDLHNYPAPEMYLYDAKRVNVLGEYGGIGYAVKGHLWAPDRNWGYIQFNSSDEVTDEYEKYAESLYDYIMRGFSAAVYTQTTDVEIEVNGLMTYDRKVDKVDMERVRAVNEKICRSLDEE